MKLFRKELCFQDRDSVPPSSGQEIENTQTHPKLYLLVYQSISVVSHYSFAPVLLQHLTIIFLNFTFFFPVSSSKKNKNKARWSFRGQFLGYKKKNQHQSKALMLAT